MASSIRTRKIPVPSPGKQSHSEVSAVSLESIHEDLTEIKNDLKKTVKEDKLESLVTSIIKKLLTQNNEELENKIREEVDKRSDVIEEKYAKKLENMSRTIEMLEQKTVSLTEHLQECKKELREQHRNVEETEKVAVEALRRSNHNEQYSRKYNFKIMGITEKNKENTWEVMKSFVKENAGVDLQNTEIVAAHRIPGEKGKSRPILVKLANTSVKARVMKKRAAVKVKGYRLVDDVTKANVELIKRLSQLDEVESAWYFNGSVFGKIGERRIKFDVTDDLENKVKKVKS